MKKSDFQEGFPGRLAPTTFTETQDGQSRIVNGSGFIPHPLPPRMDRTAVVGSLYDVLDRAKTNLLRLEATVEALPEPKVLLAAMQSREAQASSKIENTFASLREIAIADLDPSRARDEAIEVRRNRLAIEAGLKSSLPISVRLLCEMHRVLIVDPRHRPGKLRDRQVCIGDPNQGFAQARFVPPPATELEECLKQWELFANPAALGAPERERWPYLIELALGHYQFEAIHPFSDGNGRLGRALANVAPVKDKFLRQPVCNLSEWVQSNRQEYYDRLLRVSTHGEWTAWIRFFCTALAEQAELDLQRAARVRALYRKYTEMVSGARKSSLLTKLIERLFRHPALTIPIAAKVLDVTYPAAQRHVEYLVKAGVLQQISEGNYDKTYVAPAIIRAIRGQGED